MKQFLRLLAVNIVTVAIAILSGCEGEGDGSAPQNLVLGGTNYGQEVLLSWEESSGGPPGNYLIYFRQIDTTDFVLGATISGDTLEYTHDPQGMTGDYYVAARFGGTEYSSDTLTTIPVHTDIAQLSELNAAGESGYGWALAGDFSGSVYAMTNASNAPLVDFYVTNFANDSVSGPWPAPWYIASPDTAVDDPGGTSVPQADWRATWFSDPLLDPQAILPNFGPTTYFEYMSGIQADTIYIGVYLEAEQHYALAKFFGADTTTGTMQVETWFQSVPDLRLLAH
ncbi:MAG: hypothetical protein JSV98_00980 [candidate division WOR-3 bacterium]|nr:MAG: hypothetical protein JSV98_00980 [candidate division WOR-3 bacterium]